MIPEGITPKPPRYDLSKFHIYNTLSGKKELFTHQQEGLVRIYACGPTVNDVPHLGHARQQVVFDVLRTYLEYLGNTVQFVTNITDVDDKIINKAKELNEHPHELAKRNLATHLEQYKLLGITEPTERPKATEYISEMINVIKSLEEKGHTYLIEGDGVFFDVSSFQNYGKLSHTKPKYGQSGTRVSERTAKKNHEDFALWKFSDGVPAWTSPWGTGRPGWHVECSAMSHSTLGLPLDIHGGGLDLKFPHHEDEIAQSEAAFGVKLANYWMHNGLVTIENVKMSKSKGNYISLDGFLKHHTPDFFRYMILGNHYRKPIDYNPGRVAYSKASHTHLKELAQDAQDDGNENHEAINRFKTKLNNDLDTPGAISVIWDLARRGKHGKRQTLKIMDDILKIGLFNDIQDERTPEHILQLAKERQAARAKRNYSDADKHREELKKMGWEVRDTRAQPGYELHKR